MLISVDRYSYAAHLVLEHSSNSPHAIFGTLQSMDVHVSESIPSLLSIEQDGSVFTVHQGTGYLHIEESDGKLCLHGLKNKRRRRVCLVRHLAIALLKHFGVLDPANGTNLGSILVAGSIFEVDELLESVGIIEGQGIERSDIEEASYDESCACDDGQTSSRALTNIITCNEAYSSPGISNPPSTHFAEVVERPDMYKKLLEALTAQAEVLANEGLPTKYSLAVARTMTSQGLSTYLALGSNVNGERDSKAGAPENYS